MSCRDDTLTVTWSTDVTFNATVTEIPHDLQQRLTNRLLIECKHPYLSLVITNNIPP